MTKFDFKVGDKVYYPTATNTVIKLERSAHSKYYPLLGEWDSCDGAKKYAHCFLSDGRLSCNHKHPSIFPVTQEWYDKLIHIYPNLEKPPVKKTPREIIQAMLNDGWKNIVCYVSDSEPNPNIHNTRFPLVVNAIEDGEFYVRNGYKWEYATPFDPKTGKTIVDYVNGEMVLESENE